MIAIYANYVLTRFDTHFSCTCMHFKLHILFGIIYININTIWVFMDFQSHNNYCKNHSKKYADFGEIGCSTKISNSEFCV